MAFQRVFLLSALTVLLALALSALWEFSLEDVIEPHFASGFSPKNTQERWESVIVSVGLIALALIMPTWLALKSILAQKQAEEALRTNEEKFRVALGGSPISIGTVDRDLRYTWFYNPVVGFTPESMVGKRDDELGLQPDDAAALIGFKQSVLESGVGGREEFTLQLPAGDSTFDIVAEPLRDRGGAIVGLAVSSTDITEHKQVESEQQFQANIIETMEEGVVLVQLDTAEIVYANPNYEAMFGYEPGEMNGKHGSILNAGTEDEKNETVRIIMAEINETGGWRGEVHNAKKDGSAFWCYATVKIMDHPEFGPVGVSIHTDISESKRAKEEIYRLNEDLERRVEERTTKLSESEARLKEAERAALMGHWQFDVGTGEMIRSDQDIRNYGLEPGQMAPTFEAFLQAVHPDDRDMIKARAEKALSPREADQFEFRSLWPDGQVRTILTKRQLALDDEGNLVRILGVNQDITERKRLEQQILRSERLATLGQLTATVSHELRNPLGSIRTSAFIVSDNIQDSDPRIGRALERIERSVVRCDRIIDELLDFTRISKLDAEPTTIDDLLNETLDEQPLPDGVVLERDFGLRGRTLPLDRDRFRRVAINVFDNACQAMIGEDNTLAGPGERVLTVRTRERNERIEVIFEDSGPGITPDIFENIFMPLFSTKGFGVGLGLPVVKQIMEQHGGGIEIETGQGRGTKVCLWLPIK